jgi:CRP-like cAMP-binding protein
MALQRMLEEVCIVSCDIVGFGLLDAAIQVEHVWGLNEVVRTTLQSSNAIWASGGDGGHIVFPMVAALTPTPDFTRVEIREKAARRAISLMACLHHWAETSRVELRITGHFGNATRVTGADERTQWVGEGINLCGSLLDFGAPGALVVSDEFQTFIRTTNVEGLTFKDDRTVYLKHFSPRRIYLLDIDFALLTVLGEHELQGNIHSRWGEPTKSERHLLEEALRRAELEQATVGSEKDGHLPWRILYHAKRLLQSNTRDQRAQQALLAVAAGAAGELLAHRPGTAPEHNLFLSEMDPKTFTEFSLGAELVERENGERLCHRDDEGDVMFLVLTGEVGVVVSSPRIPAHGADVQPATREPPRDVRFGPGHMVGELAFVLHRNRTAALQVIGRTAVLAFNYRRVEEIFSRAGAHHQRPVRSEILRHFNDRTMDFLCNHAPYLIGPDQSGPLKSVPKPWQFLRGSANAETFQIDATKNLGMRKVIRATDEIFRRAPGLYVLASGQFSRRETVAGTGQHRRLLDNDVQLVDGHRLDVLWVDLPDQLVHVQHTFKTESEHAIIVHIGAQAIQNMGATKGLVKTMKTELARLMVFDVFLAYNSTDRAVAETWAAALRSNGLSVYINDPVPGERFKQEIFAAVLGSAVLVPLITASVTAKSRGKQKSWVHREVQLRQALFSGGKTNIIPIELPGGNAASVADDFSPIRAEEGRLSEAIALTVSRVKAIREGDSPAPFAKYRGEVPEEFHDAMRASVSSR